MALRDIVDVQVTRQTASITRVGFGALAFVFESPTALATRVLTFGSPSEVAASGDLTEAARAALTAAFSGDIAPSRVKAIFKLSDQDPSSGDESYVAALNAAQAVDEDWYCVAIESRADSDILAVAGWVEARNKTFVAATNQADVLNIAVTTDVASLLLLASMSRTAVIYAANALTEWPDTAWAGGQLPNDPGSVSWSYKRVPGATGSVFTAAQIDALEEKRVTRIENIQGLVRTVGGYTSDAGAYMDIIRGVDWLKQTMAEDVFIAMVNNKKIPYTNAGVAIIEGVVRARLQAAIGQNVLVDDENLTVSTPNVLEVSETDRGNRLLPDVSFTARLAGAIHRVVIRGVVSV